MTVEVRNRGHVGKTEESTMTKTGIQQAGTTTAALGAVLIAIGLVMVLINNQSQWLTAGAVFAVAGVGLRIESAILRQPEQ